MPRTFRSPLGPLVGYKCCQENSGFASWVSTNAPYLALGTCLPGYVGKPYRQCNSDGTWSDVINPCIIPVDCQPEVFGNAQWDTVAPGTLATGTCLPGYVGTTTRQCNVDGTWAPTIQFHCKKQF